ncbi:unnamed protein product, partial [Amoebophrya sp. A25]|eukprot:GSA25T00010620001.1
MPGSRGGPRVGFAHWCAGIIPPVDVDHVRNEMSLVNYSTTSGKNYDLETIKKALYAKFSELEQNDRNWREPCNLEPGMLRGIEEGLTMRNVVLMRQKNTS